MERKFFMKLLVLAGLVNKCYTYDPPQAMVEALYPKGIRISIPDEEGISLVAFHINFNEEFYSLEAGSIARDIIKVRDGRWVYQDRSTEVKKGDIIYYWIHVVYKGLGYNKLDQQHNVVDFYNLDGSVHNEDSSAPNSPSCETWFTEGNGQRQQACRGQLLFEDNFDDLNKTRWMAVEKFSGSPDYEFVVYQNNDQNVKVENGELRIMPTLLDDTYGPDSVRHGTLMLDRCTGVPKSTDCVREAQGFHILPPVISGHLHTKSSFTFTYGRVEIRAKIPQGDWIYPVLSLKSTKDEGERGPFYEIRIASASGNEQLKSSQGVEIGNQMLRAGLISIDSANRNPKPRQDAQKSLLNGLWSDNYHSYEVIWRRDRAIFKVDGEQYGEQRLGPPFDNSFYLSLDLAVGGHNEFPDACRSKDYAKPWQNFGPKALLDFYKGRDDWGKTWRKNMIPLLVDYVKVWAL